MVHPIYEGDFSNNSKSFLFETNEFKSKDKKLYIVAILGCPFCMDALQRMVAIQKKNQKIKIEFIVCSLNHKSIDLYKRIAPKGVEFSVSQNEKLMNDVAGGTFPTFVYSDGKSLKIRKNDYFGVIALDEIVSEF